MVAGGKLGRPAGSASLQDKLGVSLCIVRSSVRAVLHGVSGKFLAVRNHETD